METIEKKLEDMSWNVCFKRFDYYVNNFNMTYNKAMEYAVITREKYLIKAHSTSNKKLGLKGQKNKEIMD